MEKQLYIQMNVTGKTEETLGNYKVGKSIGEGTFGKVRLGTHILTQEKVAVKTLQKQKIIEQSDIERVTRQICILKILRHPNIIQLYEIIETKTDIHLIMEYAEGGELFDYIVKNKRVQQAQAVKFMQQILSGVQYIHKNGIVHRDLKPQNLLLDSKKNIKIVDFGLSNQYKNGEKLKTACGSPCYAAPEMIAGKKYECLNVDIWSCGIIIFAMICGYLPFQDPNTNKLYKKIIAGDFQMPKILSSEARDILRNILNVNPQARYKISQIRSSRWYNIYKPKYEAKGIIIGKDQIIPDDGVIRRMAEHDFDPVQSRTYILNNRHNHVTATYYLFQRKLQKETKVAQKAQKKQNEKQKKRERQESPLIYRPDKKQQFYIPQSKKSKQIRDASKNDSINASNIITSLVQANKNKLVNQKFVKRPQNGNFERIEDFKLFPKKLNSSIHESDYGKKKVFANKSICEDQSIQTKRTSYTGNQSKRVSNTPGPSYSTELESSEPLNKKRQQLSDQLKQISVKIDKQIVELRKQNESMQEGGQRESLGSNINSVSSSTNRKRNSESFNFMNSRQKVNISQEIPSHLKNNYVERDRIVSQGNSINVKSTINPKQHSGPFNVKCLFMENAISLQRKIVQFLKINNLNYVENEPFVLRTSDNHKIWIQTLGSSTALTLVNFSQFSQINDQILDSLAK